MCSANRVYSIYNCVQTRSRTPKRAKLGLVVSVVHVRTRLCSCFFGVGPPKNEKRAILCEKVACCELASSLSSLDISSEREPAIRRVLCASGNAAYTGGGLRAHRRGLERPQLARHGLLSPVPTPSPRPRRPRRSRRARPKRQHRCHHHRRRRRACACASCRPPWPTGSVTSRDERGPCSRPASAAR